MAEFHFQIMTTGGVIYDGPVEQVIAPAWEGSIGILSGHAPMICLVRHGALRVDIARSSQYLAVGEGVLEVRRDKVILLAAWAEKAESVEAANTAAMAARERELRLRASLAKT